MSGLRARTLRGESQFSALFREGRKMHSRGIMLIVSSGNPGGIAVCSSRMKRAVDRNRRKRIIRAALQPLVPAIKPGCSVAVFADLEFEKLSLPERTATLRDAFVRARLLEP